MYSCHKKWFLTSLRRAYSHAAAGPNILLCRRTLHKFASGRRAGQTHLREIFARNFGSKSSKIQRTPSSSTITLLSQSDSKCIESPGFGASKGILNALQITSFDEKALRKYFDAMDLDRSETLSRQEVLSFLKRTEQNGSAEEEGAGDKYGSTRQVENVCEAIGDSHIHQSSIRSSDPPAAPGEDYLERVLLRKFFDDTADEISFETFQRICTQIAEERDPQIWPIAGTMLIAGSAVGVILPVMPLLVKELGISQAQFGIIVAAFGFSKLLANIPAATLTDRIGRRPVMVGGLGLISMGMIGFGMAETFSHLAVARLMTGVGVSALIAGATMSVTDISTQINRARMIAPMTAAFSAGAIVGPGVGGLLASSQGTHVTFYCVGGIFALNAVYTQIIIQETSPYHLDQARTTASKTGSPPAPKISQEGRQSRSMLDDIREWGPIWQDSKIRTLMFLNMSYWAATAGANMTLLPLMLASEKFNLEPAMIGAAFAIQSAVSVAGAVPVASLADRIGPNKIIAPGMAITGVAMASFPFTETVPTAFGVLAFWALGSTMLGSAPTAYAANLSTEKNRTQVLALLRTMGDVGLLVGSSSVGITAGMVGNDLAMQGTASFVALSTAWFLIRQRGGSAKAAGGH